MRKYTAIFCFLLLVFVISNAQAEPIVDTFFITVDSNGEYTGGGSGFNEGEWYLYPNSGWINEWFYDHPLDFHRGKIIHVEFDAIVVDPALYSGFCLAINWTFPEWSYLGYGEETPPLPNLVGEDECTYIAREIVETICPVPQELTHYIYDFIVYDYNPEWVSIDVMGENFEILNGIIEHECVDKQTPAQNETWGAVKSLYK